MMTVGMKAGGAAGGWGGGRIYPTDRFGFFFNIFSFISFPFMAFIILISDYYKILLIIFNSFFTLPFPAEMKDSRGGGGEGGGLSS